MAWSTPAESAPRRTRRRTDEPASRLRLDVLSVTVDDAVRCAGGWMADRALAGWDVEVFVAQPDNGFPDALRIVGASAHSLSDALVAGPRADAVAVAADLFTADAEVREHVLRAYDRDLVEVTAWGEVPAELGARLSRVEHVLSSAAQAFKGYALCAASPFVSGGAGAVEAFRSGALRGLAGDLIPAASGG